MQSRFFFLIGGFIFFVLIFQNCSPDSESSGVSSKLLSRTGGHTGPGQATETAVPTPEDVPVVPTSAPTPSPTPNLDFARKVDFEWYQTVGNCPGGLPEGISCANPGALYETWRPIDFKSTYTVGVSGISAAIYSQTSGYFILENYDVTVNFNPPLPDDSLARMSFVHAECVGYANYNNSINGTVVGSISSFDRNTARIRFLTTSLGADYGMPAGIPAYSKAKCTLRIIP